MRRGTFVGETDDGFLRKWVRNDIFRRPVLFSLSVTPKLNVIHCLKVER
jgi:hypothetical protein